MERESDTSKLLELFRAGQPKPPDEVDTKTVRYALYARKSTTSDDRQASSIEDQIKDCMERLIQPQGLNIVKVYQESYSAKVADMRIKFNEMVNEIENGRIDGVIAWHPDRLSRNMKEAGTVIDLVDRGLIRDLQFSTFNFDNTPAGKMLLGITFVMAKQYSEHLSESVDRGNKRKTEVGTFIGKFKHGYVVENRNFVPDPHNFTKVKHMFEMALEGKSQKDIRLWINEQGYTVQKRAGGEYQTHVWSKDDVSQHLKDPHYAGVHRWGKNYTDLTELYDFEPMITDQEYLRINKIDTLGSQKVYAINHPKGGTIKANMLRGRVTCGACEKKMTSMVPPKRDPETNEIIHRRYYFKCENIVCTHYNKSIRAGVVIDTAQKFFEQYLFVTKTNYTNYIAQAQKTLKSKTVEIDSDIARLKVLIANKERVYEQTKILIRDNPSLQNHYDLDKDLKVIETLKRDYKKALKLRERTKDSLPTFEQYLKLLESTPVILGKIRNMKVMDVLLRIFFSNFTITPISEGTFKGSEVSYKLNEPWNGFVENGNFVRGAG